IVRALQRSILGSLAGAGFCSTMVQPTPRRPSSSASVSPTGPAPTMRTWVYDLVLEELVTANRILAHEGVVDGFGHVTVRHPQRPDRFLMSRARAPDCVEVADLIEFTLDGTPVDAKGRKPYLERFIHGAVYEARPEIMSVVHNHSPSTIPFGITAKRLRPLMHMCATIGHEVPVWDI